MVETARRCRDAGISALRPGGPLSAAAHAIEALATRAGCSVVREYGGHGIGRRMHQAPWVPHAPGLHPEVRLKPGMALTVEPMICLGDAQTRLLEDGWTVVTADGRLSAQFEPTVLITKDGVEVLTAPPG